MESLNNWILTQTVDLAKGPTSPLHWDAALMEAGDDRAHTWQVSILNDGVPVQLDGVKVRGYFNREHSEDTVFVEGTADGNVATVVLDQACYAIPGTLTGILRLTMPDGAIITAAVVRWQVGDGIFDAIVDPGGHIPSLDDLLARIDEMERATKAANEGASAARSAAGDARAAAKAAGDATQAARELTDRWDDVSLEYEVLPPSENPWASLTQTEHETTFRFGLPTSNLAYSTFEVSDDMQLIMTSPDGTSDIGFQLTQDGDLEVIVN